MQGIVFVYEKKPSIQNRLLTVRIEERRKKAGVWIPAGGKQVYTARDLQMPGLNILDKAIFSLAFKSETDLRKMEAHFFSLDEEYTRFRISPCDLKVFLERCNARGILCGKDGRVLRFQYTKNSIPDIRFKDVRKDVNVFLSLDGQKKAAFDYATASDPVRIISGTHVYELPKGLPAAMVGDLIQGITLPVNDVEGMVEKLSQYAGKLSLSIPGKPLKERHHAPVVPVIDFHPSFKFADLGFEYKDIGVVPMKDQRQILFDPPKNLEVHRNVTEEQKYRKQLESFGAELRGTNRGDWFIPEGKREHIINNARKHGFALTLSGNCLIPDIQISWDIKTENQEIFVGGTVQYQEGQASLENILDACLCGQCWFDLPGGFKGFIPGRLARDFEYLELRGDVRDDDIRFEGHDLSFVARFFSHKKNVVHDPAFSCYLAFLNDRCTPDSPVRVPDTLKATLRPYQKTGFSWLHGLYRFGFCGILADDMGLGKTLQVLAFLLDLKKRTKGAHLTLVIVPTTLIWNWESEVNRFAPDLNLQCYTGASRDKSLPGLSDTDLMITSYGLVRQDAQILNRVSWDLVVLDEAQAIKNPDSQIAGSVKTLRAASRICLTGTPIENRPLDLWSQFDFLMPGFLGDRTSFQNTYGDQNRDALNRLNILTAPFILRRMKKQVCRELPAKTEITLLCDFSREQKACYDEMLNTGRHQLFAHADNQPREHRTMQILTLLLRLRQAACHPALLPGAEPGENIRPEESSNKFELVLETALEILSSGYKILIFSQFVALLELAGQMFNAYGIKQYALYGTTQKRQEQILGFKKSPDPCIFLISLKTGGVGLNLTEAGYVFLLDPWWNPAVENQAVDRSHRIGQENPVTVYRFITRNSVEENVSRLQARKRDMGETILGHTESTGAPFSEKELLELI